MAKVTDLRISFPVGEVDLMDTDAIRARVISYFDDGSCAGALTSLNEQTVHAQGGPRPRGGSVSCKADTSGKVSCEATWGF
ncbi:MAG: hypothetical protein Q7T74_05275 [Candidatus Saccharibacteria bacterium]|nr:hypothetical protein [Candidatus Saccharibacteria bacterium]